MFPVVETSPNGTGIYAKVLRFGLTALAGGSVSHGLFLAGSEPVHAALFGMNGCRVEQRLDGFSGGSAAAKGRGAGGRIVAIPFAMGDSLEASGGGI